MGPLEASFGSTRFLLTWSALLDFGLRLLRACLLNFQHLSIIFITISIRIRNGRSARFPGALSRRHLVRRCILTLALLLCLRSLANSACLPHRQCRSPFYSFCGLFVIG